LSVIGNGCQRVCVMESCVFCERRFSVGKSEFAKKQQTLIKLKVAIFYTHCCKMRVYFFHYNFQ
jgi:hypothetical protein